MGRDDGVNPPAMDKENRSDEQSLFITWLPHWGSKLARPYLGSFLSLRHCTCSGEVRVVPLPAPFRLRPAANCLESVGHPFLFQKTRRDIARAGSSASQQIS